MNDFYFALYEVGRDDYGIGLLGATLPEKQTVSREEALRVIALLRRVLLAAGYSVDHAIAQDPVEAV